MEAVVFYANVQGNKLDGCYGFCYNKIVSKMLNIDDKGG
jgi:hypothetical protein